MTDITATKTVDMWRRKLIESAHDAVISIDHRQRIDLLNPAAEKMFGYTAEEAMGKNVNILMPEPYASEHEGYIARYERSGEGHVIGKTRELVARRKSGEIFPIELSLTEIGEGRELRYVAFLRDISEKAQLQAQATGQARLETVDVTTAMMVHEIANPLYGISVTLEILQRQIHKTTKKTVGATLERMGDEISRLKALIKDYRSLAARDQYRFLPSSLPNVIEEFCTMEMPKLVVKGITLETEFESGLPAIYADREKIKQILLNLCQNAEDAMPEGGALTLKCYESAGKVILEVRDTGVGIPEDFDLFVPFKTTKSFGTGLGLIITQRIVERHEGRLSYTSEAGKGTTFTVAFPACTAS
jgi:two-component system sensor kinase FixL